MKGMKIISFHFLSLCFCVTIINCSVISDRATKTDDALVIEPQPFSNSTEPVLLEEDEDIFDDDTPVKYNGAKLFRIAYDNQHKRNAVAELQESFEVAMWSLNQNHTTVDVMVRKQVVNDVIKYLKGKNVPYRILIDDLQRAIDTENPPQEEIENLQNRKARKTRYWDSTYNSFNRMQSRSIPRLYYHPRQSGTFLGYNSLDPPQFYHQLWQTNVQPLRGHRMTWEAYHRVFDIYGYLDYLANTYPDLCSVMSIGLSAQGRPLKVLRISNGKQSNKAIWMDGGIHAREWISPASVTYMINKFVEEWDEQPPHIQNIDWYVLPMTNPDGYEYTHDVDRLWRKNRGGSGRGRCSGVDLNRNFGYHWGGQGASRQPCSETFAGSGAFSEPETRAIKEFMDNSAADFQAFLTFHSYGQYILYPWGYDRTVPPDYMDLDRVGKEAAMKIQQMHGVRYSVGPSGSLLYPASGASDDWAKGKLGIKYAFTIELRDSGRYGFILPASMIEITAKEALIVVHSVAKAVANL